jgi:hypothetical protein
MRSSFSILCWNAIALASFWDRIANEEPRNEKLLRNHGVLPISTNSTQKEYTARCGVEPIAHHQYQVSVTSRPSIFPPTSTPVMNILTKFKNNQTINQALTPETH